jgi:hypothetical protein
MEGEQRLRGRIDQEVLSFKHYPRYASIENILQNRVDEVAIKWPSSCSRSWFTIEAVLDRIKYF